MSFFGEYELLIDEKNRVSIPAEIRRQLSPNTDTCKFFVKLGTNGVPWVYSEAKWTELTKDDSSGMEAGKGELDRQRFHYGMTFPVEADRQGRSVIPERILKKTRTGREVVLVGVKDHLELWNRAAWDAYTDELLSRYAGDEGKSHQTQQPAGTV
jgi:MraZ protein